MEFLHKVHDAKLGPKGLRPIHRAAAAGCLPLVKHLGGSNTGLAWESSDHGLSCLECAACGNTDDHADVVAYLLQTRRGRSSHMRHTASLTSRRSTPLHHAASGGHPRIVTALSLYAEWWNKRDAQGLTPFAVACAHGHLECVKLMAANENCLPDNPAPALNGDTPLMQVRAAVCCT